MTSLKVSGLSVHYEKRPALTDVTFEVPLPQLVAIVGPNGAGKSTLIQALLGLVKPKAGKIELSGNQKIAYVPQKDSVDWDFPTTVEDLVLMGCYGRLGLFRWPSNADRDLCHAVLNQVDMFDFKGRQINALSGGQKQRIFIARALMQQADLFFLDEPFQGIDAASETLIMNLLKAEVKQGKSVFVVLHDLDKIEKHFEWVIMLNGTVMTSGKTREVFTAENIAKTYGKHSHLIVS